MSNAIDLKRNFENTRNLTLKLVSPLTLEDYVIQSSDFVSPAKWHLAHTTWFFEEFILSKFNNEYKLFNKNYSELFNSYYNSVGKFWEQARRGTLSRPTTEEIISYRNYVDHQMVEHIDFSNEKIKTLIEIGINHEQQHQELILMDIKYNFANNPLNPAFIEGQPATSKKVEREFYKIQEGVYQVGSNYASGFCYDNETPKHKTYLENFEISKHFVTCDEYIEFIEDGGYQRFEHWHSDGFKWVNENKIKAPLYWENRDDEWTAYTLYGRQKIDRHSPVSHISFYEAAAYCSWAGVRLPTEFEWEVASQLNTEGSRVLLTDTDCFQKLSEVQIPGQSMIGNLWCWTSSAYCEYPNYKRPSGAIGEYNQKFMCNQIVLRGGSFATPKEHIRTTYRNFFYPDQRWMFSGIKVAR